MGDTAPMQDERAAWKVRNYAEGDHIEAGERTPKFSTPTGTGSARHRIVPETANRPKSQQANRLRQRTRMIPAI
jgi:hypothetical protein